MEQVSLEASDLVTVAGASAAAIILTQFIKRLFDLAAKATRSVALGIGLVIVVTTTVVTGETDPLTLILAGIVGAQAGLAASATFDAAKEGLGHETFPAGTRESASRGLAITHADELDELSPARGE